MNTAIPRVFFQVGLSLACSIVISVLSCTAHAEVSPEESATAQALFEQAKQMSSGGDYAAACPKFEESQRLDPTSGTLINLADCYEKVGRLATAWTTFLDAATAAGRSGNSAREQAARERAQSLVPKLPKIVTAVVDADRTPGLEIRRDGKLVGAAQWSVPIPVDLGEHRIVASAPKRKPWEIALTVRSPGEMLRVTVPVLDALTPPNSSESTTLKRQSVADGAPAPTHSSGALGTQRVLGLVAGGLGVVGVALGSVYGLKSKSRHDQAEQYCAGTSCLDPRGIDLKSQAVAAGNISTVAFVIGAVGLGAGAVLWFTADSASAPQVGVAVGSLHFGGAF